MVDCLGAVRRVSAWTLFNAFVFIVFYAFGYTLGHYDGPCSKLKAGRNHDIDGIHNNPVSFDIWIDHCSLVDYDERLIDITVSSSNMVIDATNKGNKSRFINHSCERNTEMQKWTVDGETRVGIFALLDMERGEELAYDYRFVHFGADQDCHCGSSNSRKMVGTSRSVNSFVLRNGNSASSQD